MTTLQALGLLLFGILFYKCAKQVPPKWQRRQHNEPGATADLGLTLLGCGFCLWAIVATLFFPG